MSRGLDERSRLVASTVNRLRLIQADFADENAEVRDDYLSDEVQRALNKVTPDERRQFLEDLQTQFPTWDERVEMLAPGAESAGKSAFDERELSDPAFLVSRLVDLAPTLSEADRQAAVDRLAEAGLARAGGGDWPAALATDLRAKLAMDKADPIEPTKVLELAMFLADFALSLDQLVWATWRQIAPKSLVRRQTPLQRIVGRFVKGDPDVPRGQVSQDLERLRQLTAALISSVAQVGRQFAHRHLAKVSPTEIDNWAKMEKGGFMTSHEARCWRKYVELAKTLDESTIEAEIFQAIADFTGRLISGLDR